jgi:ATP-dependent Clp protease ATP-binding subunit ClpB
MQPTDPDQFTAKAWDAIVEAQDVARRCKHQYMEVEHVIIAMLDQEEDGLAHKVWPRPTSTVTYCSTS